MPRRKLGRGHGVNPSQFRVDRPGGSDGKPSETWSPRDATATAVATPSPTAPPPPDVQPLVQRLPWDFRDSFPEPVEEAVEAGLVDEEDLQLDSFRALHEEHGREALATLRALEVVLDARRRGVDPKRGKPPMTHAARKQLARSLRAEADRLQRWWQTLIDTYESAFGPEAAGAFAKAIRSWHAGIPVVAERRSSPTMKELPLLDLDANDAPHRRHRSVQSHARRAIATPPGVSLRGYEPTP